MKCALHNLGCKVNAYETDAMQQLLEKAGYEIVEFGKDNADIYIINTCTVTNIADRKSRQMLHKAKKDNPNSIVVAAGCYVQETGDELLQDLAVDMIIGNNNKGRIVELLDEYITSHEKNDKAGSALSDISNEKEYEKLQIEESSNHTRAYIKIQDGCNQFCSYCAIPFARGRVRSRSLADILNEVNNLANSGCREIVITGIHLSSYGLDFDNTEYNRMAVPNASHLLNVIEEIAKISKIERIRLGSLEPRIITKDFADRLKKIDKLCPHFHLSLQSGCDATLKRMNRRYDTAEYFEGVKLLRETFDRPAITTDVIVGFPQESEEEFEITREYLSKVQFFEMHVFKYSRRKGTVADKLPGQISDNVKNERSNALIKLDDELSKAYRKSFVGEDEEVLVEEIIKINNAEYATGHTKRYIKVFVPGVDEEVINTTIKVRIEDIFENDAVIGTALM